MSNYPHGFVSYKSFKTVTAEAVYQFINGSMYGAIWGLVTPFPAPGSAEAIAANRRAFLGEPFKPVPPFHSMSSVFSNAIYFGSLLAVQRYAAKTVELIRRREDFYNDLFGFAAIGPYYHYILNHSERRLVLHNRFVGGAVLLQVIYANMLA
ncbi:hypothetical protein ACA910_010615 [Epithemia clementina (nom. ined.)]